ncbi:MAG: DNA polymerase III subunit delta [bacterium]|nr:DNA polymerase III subunit delta [bacterium]
MLILLYGPDTLRSSVKLGEIIERYRNSGKAGISVRVLDAMECSSEEVEQELVSAPMFKERKLLIFKHAFEAKLLKEFLLSKAQLLKETDNTLVFVEEKDILAKDAFFQFIQKNGKTQKFSNLSGAPLLSWIVKEGESYGLDISKEAGGELCSLFQDNPWALSQEIRKMAAFKQSEPVKQVSLEDVKAIASAHSFETDIFKTIDAIAKNRKDEALELLHRHIAKGDSPLYLLSMIHFQFRNILQAKDFKGGKIPMHPFVFKKSQELASLFSMDELKAIYEKIWGTDLAVKTGVMDGEVALDALLLS